MAEDARSKRRRGAPSTEGQSPQDAQPVAVLNEEAIRTIVAQEIQAALDPILDAVAALATEARKTRIELHTSLHRFALLVEPQFTEDEEDLEDEEVEEEIQDTEMVEEHQPGRTHFRAGLPVSEPGVIALVARREVK